MKIGDKTLKSIEYRRLQLGYKEWLATLGYAESTVYGLPRMVQEFLCWLEHHKQTEIKNITQNQVDTFLEYFKNRPNERFAGGLSTRHVNKQITALQQFFNYLKLTQQARLIIHIKQLKEEPVERIFLTKEEIEHLYKATDDTLIGIRDRAMLAIYYGCGLRKSEGLELEISDVLFERRLLYVRKTKNRHERYVPLNMKCLHDLETYIYTARPLLLNEQQPTETLFISERGKEMVGQSLVVRLQVLKSRTAIPTLQSKSFGLHALRHSIATHLLQAGMELEKIALFLGHRKLDSTQIYTHIINEL